MRVDAADRVAVAIATHEPDQRHVRVDGEQPDQFGTDVAGGPDDRDPDLPRTSVGIDAALGTQHECCARLTC